MNIDERPILFTFDMVRAIIEERKFMTRRVNGLEEINENPDDWVFNWFDYKVGWCFNQKSSITKKSVKAGTFNQMVIKCPYGLKDDLLWVRETFANGNNESLDPNIGKEEKDWTMRYWLFKDGSQIYSDGEYFQDNKKGTEDSFKHVKWKPSIHMPKAACRIKLRITRIGVERLNDISEYDAVREGIINRGPFGFTVFGIDQSRTGKDAFCFLWEYINGRGSWEDNPWVWVVEFEKIKPQNG